MKSVGKNISNFWNSISNAYSKRQKSVTKQRQAGRENLVKSMKNGVWKKKFIFTETWYCLHLSASSHPPSYQILFVVCIVLEVALKAAFVTMNVTLFSPILWRADASFSSEKLEKSSNWQKKIHFWRMVNLLCFA